MPLIYTPEEEAFRTEVRHFLQNEYPKDVQKKVANGKALTREDMIAGHKAMAKGGYVAPRWPVEWGGQDWSPMQTFIFQDELLENNIAPVLGFGVGLLAPVIVEFGTQEQKERFLPAIYNADQYWCQGFSEPEAGSDLASVRTRAVRDGDNYVVNGQKMWQTDGHNADWIFMLVRTDPNAPKRQMGISFLLIDMKTPGVTVRKIRLMDGAHEVSEIFFDNVIVPAENLIGEENKGWTYAKFLLGNERGGMSNAKPFWRTLTKAKKAASEVQLENGSLMDDTLFRARLAELETQITAFEQTALRVSGTSASGAPNPGSSVIKLRRTELDQALTTLMIDVAGPNARVYDNAGVSGVADWESDTVHTYLNRRKVTIYGGSSEVQRSIISSAILGL